MTDETYLRQIAGSIGRMESKIESLADNAEERADKLDKIDRRVAAIERTLDEAKGGWRMFLMVGGFSAAVGGLVAKFLPFFGNQTPPHP